MSPSSSLVVALPQQIALDLQTDCSRTLPREQATYLQDHVQVDSRPRYKLLPRRLLALLASRAASWDDLI